MDTLDSQRSPELPGTGPSFAESPMTRIWLNADRSHGVDVEAVARLQARLAATDQPPVREGRRWRRTRR
jgi:hypothetical protein